MDRVDVKVIISPASIIGKKEGDVTLQRPIPSISTIRCRDVSLSAVDCTIAVWVCSALMKVSLRGFGACMEKSIQPIAKDAKHIPIVAYPLKNVATAIAITAITHIAEKS